MSEQILVFSSEESQRKNAANRPEDFTTFFSRTLQFPENKKYSIALLKANAGYSFHNIIATKLNNIVRYRDVSVGAAWQTVTLPNGVYSYRDIDTFVKDHMVANVTYSPNIYYTVVDGINTFDFNLSFSSTTFLCTISLSGTMEFDTYTQEFGNLIGFDDAELAVTTVGNRLPNINRSLDNLYIHSSLISETIVDGVSSDILYQFDTSTLIRGYPFKEEPFNLQFSPLAGDKISYARFYMTDVFGQLVDLNGVHVTYTVIIKNVS